MRPVAAGSASWLEPPACTDYHPPDKLVTPMKPTLDTPDRLVLSDRPWVGPVIAAIATVVFTALAVILFASGNDVGVVSLIFAVSGPVYLYFFLDAAEIVFDRAAGVVTLSHKAPRGGSQQEYPLAGLLRAAVHRPGPTPEARAVDPDASPRPAGPVRTVLVYEDGTEVALSDGFSKGETAFAEARTINAWLTTG
jgi:hypothetical protein